MIELLPKEIQDAINARVDEFQMFEKVLGLEQAKLIVSKLIISWTHHPHVYDILITACSIWGQNVLNKKLLEERFRVLDKEPEVKENIDVDGQ